MLVAVPPLRAQIVADGASRTLLNETNTFTGDVTVGTNGAFTLLVLSDNALLTNSANGLIGRNTGANSNEVRLASSSASWLMGGSLFVGTNGAANRLVVSNGATVLASGSSTIGHGGDFSGNANSNTVTVSGTGSLWSNGLDLIVGELGFANRLEVNGGGWVVNSNAFVGRSFFSPSNTVLVTGTGSLWSTRADLSLGGAGSWNLLVVSNGGWVVNSNAQVGASSLGNLALVTGINSTWSNRGDLSVGNGARENQLLVSNGALVVDNNGVLGKTVTSSNNLALVTGNGSLWSNRSDLTIGTFGRNNQLIVSDGGRVASQSGTVGNTASANNNLALVTGGGSVWSNALNLFVGFSGPDNRLVIESGGLVHCDTGYVGDFSGASNSEALVTGPGSLWANRSILTIGSQSGFNRLVVSNGATVWSGTGVMGGSVSNNRVVVTGAGSLWSNQTLLYLGGGSAGNRADVNDGGWLACNDGTIGSGFSAHNNTVVLTGSGSGWNNLAGLIVGDGGSGNVLMAINGATVLSSNATIGASTSLGNNYVLLSGAGTLWSNRNDLVVGNLSAANQLVVGDGAIFVNGVSSSIGANVAANSNSVTVTGSGSVWSNAGALNIGDVGSGNRLVITNGGRMESLAAAVGETSASSNNEAVVSGPNTSWSDHNFLSVGYGGAGNRLTVSDGGVVRSVNGSIGDVGGNNLALVTGAGSSWSNAGTLFVGAFGSRNGLTISDAAAFSSETLIVGYDSSSLNNRVVVDGGTLRATNGGGTAVLDVRRGTNVLNAGLIDVDRLLLTNTLGKFEFNGGTLITRGAVISNGAPFTVGRSGTTPAVWDVRAGVSNHVMTGQQMFLGENASFNQLLVTNGALLNNGLDVLIGQFPGAISNSATISGMGSRWAVDGYIAVGYGGSFNRLVVSNGGWMSSSLTLIGGLSNGSNNQALVTDAGSTWNTLGDLRVGYLGSASQLTVSNNGVAFASNAVYVGFDPASTKNRLTVDGGTLRVTNASATGLLDVRRGTNVLNAGLVDGDVLRLTNTLGFFEFNGGTLSVKGSTINNGQVFRVGNGLSAATIVLATNSTHSFAGGLTVSSNAAITGNGGIAGAFTVQAGGLLSPGTSIGKIVSISSPLLQGATFMEISRNGTTVTNDQLQVMGSLTYGGTLTVTNIGPNPLASGNHFQLFSAAPYAGSFTAISLPPLAPGLNWTNKLTVNGSIDVVGTPLPKFASITLLGTNVIITGTNGLADAPYTVLTSTNVVLPLSNWVNIATNQFGPNGEFSFTNGIAPGIPQRFYRISIYD